MEWFIVWCIVLLLVHVQFKHCVPVTVVLVKVIEASLITFLIKIWYLDRDIVEVLKAQTI